MELSPKPGEPPLGLHCVSLLLLTLALTAMFQATSGQPTIQNGYWQHTIDFSKPSNYIKDGDSINPRRSRGSGRNIRLTSPTPSSTGSSIEIQRSLDAVLLELQRRGSDADEIRRGMSHLQQRHDDSRRLLLQLTESVNIIVKELLKNPSSSTSSSLSSSPSSTSTSAVTNCDCSSLGVNNDGDGGGGGGDGDGLERREDQPRQLQTGIENSKVQRARESPQGGDTYHQNLDGYVSSGNPSHHLPKNIGEHSGSRLTNSDINNHLDSRKQLSKYSPGARDFSLSEKVSDARNDEDDVIEGENDDEDIVMEMTTPAATTTTPDPILHLYNGTVPKDCDDLRHMGYSRNGTYVIRPTMADRSFRVLCEFHHSDPYDPQGQGHPSTWTLIQRRQDGSEDFYRSWQQYKKGFGDLRAEFWLGNENIHQLTNQDQYRLRIDMWEWPRVVSSSSKSSLTSSSSPSLGSKFLGEPVSKYYFAESSSFSIDNETNRYALHVPSDYFAYTGFGGSGLRIHAGPFLTHDLQKNSLPQGMRENCAEKFHCGWWFTTCVRNANFNGRYYKGGYKDDKKKKRARDDIYWPNIEQSLYKVVMKIARVTDRTFT